MKTLKTLFGCFFFASLLFFTGCSNETEVSKNPPLSNEDKTLDPRFEFLFKEIPQLSDAQKLIEYSASPDDRIRALVAQNPNTPVTVLTQLSNDSEWVVKNYLGTNTALPKELAEKLSKDRDERVQWTIARNPNVSEEILTSFIGGPESVEESLAKNKGLSETLLVEMAKNIKSVRALEIMAKRSNLPELVKIALLERKIDSVTSLLNPPQE